MTEIAQIDNPPTEIDAAQPMAVTTPMTMIDRALTSGASPEILERLFALQERWEANEGRKAFDRAISLAKAEIPPILKNREVDFTSAKGRTHYKHEDLAEIARTVDPILGRHGLSYRYRTEQAENAITVTCILSHRDGYSEENPLSCPPDVSGNKNHIQAIASAVTYLQRYTLKAALGLAAAHDDDGQAAGAGPAITAEQYQALRAKIEATGADEDALCRHFKIEGLHDLPQQRYGIADAMLDQKAKRIAEERADA